MKTPRIPTWVAPFCCVTPFVALIGFSVTTGFGAAVGTPALICLIVLCGRIISTLLNDPKIEQEFPKIENRK